MSVLPISKYLAFLFSLILLSCSHQQEVGYVYEGVRENPFQLFSKHTETQYKLQVYLPKNYDYDNEKKPVIYALDGQWCFDVYSNVLDERNIEAVLVGIWQGPSGRRETDYTFVGNRSYLRFFEDELLPYVESKYRINTHKRILVGTSLGGSFVGYALLEGGGFTSDFEHLIAIDPGFRANDQQGQALATIEQYKELVNEKDIDRINPPKLFITSSSQFSFITSAYEFIDMLTALGFPESNLDHTVYEESHDRVNYPSFIYAIERIFTDK